MQGAQVQPLTRGLRSHMPCSMTAAAAAKSLQSCPTLCDPVDGSPPGSAVPGILQAKTLEWVCSMAKQNKTKQKPLRIAGLT